MKLKNLYYTLLLTSLMIGKVAGQQRQNYELLLRSGSFVPERNVSSGNGRGNAAFKFSDTGQKSFVIIQFDEIPTEETRRALKEEGVELLEYIPHNAYTATIAPGGNPGVLARTRGRAVVELERRTKNAAGSRQWPYSFPCFHWPCHR
ncbi:hypothetical protein [Dyadobacter sp. 676]|uniref:Uncharacterized protein n=1 Tax=Dyadobacter sp. 676 TaxID=3088362 RepID=A0AAU8FSF1_9BACT